MGMNCPFCTVKTRDLLGVLLHVIARHPGEIEKAEEREFISLPVTGECDMDAIYTKRPDLIKRNP